MDIFFNSFVIMSSRCNESFYKLLDSFDVCSTSQMPLSDQERHATTGLVHCVLTRVKTTPSSVYHRSDFRTYNFAIEMPVTYGEEITQLILTGVHDSGHSYSIYAIPTDTSQGRGNKIGSLVRVQMNMYSISYVLKNASNVSIAYIVYHVPSPIKVLRDAPARFVQLAVHQISSKSDTNDERHASDPVETAMVGSTSTSSYFDKACMYSISRHHDLRGVIAIQDDDPSIHVMQSMAPYICSSSGNITLNFRGRGKYASPKNMQLVSTSFQSTTKSGNYKHCKTNSDDDTKISLQMCKWDKDTYHIDFDVLPYMSYLHAFAFGLAQVDL